MRIALLSLLFVLSTFLSACGFNFPNQIKLSEAIPSITVIGDYHHYFYKSVIHELQLSGVKVDYQKSGYTPDTKNTKNPILYIAEPLVEKPVVAVDSKGQALEYNLFIKIAATLKIAKNKNVLIKNALTRSIVSKTGQSLATANEEAILAKETYQELATQLVLRLSYLGKLSDPDSTRLKASDLVADGNEIIELDSDNTMTLIEALQNQDLREKEAAKIVSLDEINDNKSINKEPRLPKTHVELINK